MASVMSQSVSSSLLGKKRYGGPLAGPAAKRSNIKRHSGATFYGNGSNQSFTPKQEVVTGLEGIVDTGISFVEATKLTAEDEISTKVKIVDDKDYETTKREKKQLVSDLEFLACSRR
jgi:hypothetical protein